MYIIIVGCGRVGVELATMLSLQGENVVIIDQDSHSFGRLGPGFNGITITGHGFNREILEEAGIKRADALAAVSNEDSANAMTALIAKKIYKVPRVIVRIHDPLRAHSFGELGLDVLSGTTLVARMFREKIIDNRLTSFLGQGSGELGVLEVGIDEKLADKKIREINLKEEFVVSGLRRNGELTIPGLDSVVKKGDTVLGVVRLASLDKVKKKLGLS